MRLSVTDLEAFRLCMASDWFPVGLLLDRLRGLDEENEKMRRGTAWHAFLENAPAGKVDCIMQNGYEFILSLNASVDLPRIQEQKIERTFHVDGVDVTLVGKVDGIGEAISDHKLSESFDAEKYMDSYQWRAYLLLFDAWKFVYNVFEYFERKDGALEITDLHQLELYRYPNLESDVLGLLRDFVAFLKTNLPERLVDDATVADKLLPF